MPLPLPTIRAVCFDLDGLMFNTEHIFYESAGVLLERRGLSMSREVMNAMLGRRPLESMQVLIEYWDLNVGPVELLAESQLIFQTLLESRLEPMPGLFDLLHLIEANGLPKGVATSSPRDHLAGIFERFDLSRRFPLQLTAESVTLGKPHPEIYLKAAAHWGIPAAEMLILEATQTGTCAGAAAGAFVVSIPHDHTADHDFSQASYVATSLSDPYIRQLVTSGTAS